MKCAQKIRYFPTFTASITNQDTDNLKTAKQYYSDCYLMATLDCLTNSYNGKRILKQQIHKDANNVTCYMYNPKGEKEKYEIPKDIAIQGYEKLYENQPDKIVRAMDITVAQYEKKHHTKPFICRISEIIKNYRFENNVPSLFMEQFTGVKPITIGNSYTDISLKKHKKELIPIFEKMAREKNYSFVIATGIKSFEGRRYHVYSVEDINLLKNTITVKQKRTNIPITMDIDEALSTFQTFSGYFNQDLAKNLPNEHSKEFVKVTPFWKN